MDILAFENRVKHFTQNIAFPVSSSSSVTDKLDTIVSKSCSEEDFTSTETPRENSEATMLVDDVFENLDG